MKIGPLMFHATAVMVFVQLVAGALIVFAFMDAGIHIITGVITFAIVVATMIITLVSKPRVRALSMISVVLFLLVILQGALGFIAFDSDAVVVIHFTTAMVIYALAVTGVIYARKWNQMAAASSSALLNPARAP